MIDIEKLLSIQRQIELDYSNVTVGGLKKFREEVVAFNTGMAILLTALYSQHLQLLEAVQKTVTKSEMEFVMAYHEKMDMVLKTKTKEILDNLEG